MLLDLAWFGGHFATFPLVPGVIEVQWAMDLAASLGWANGSIKQIENLKYQHFVRPNDTVDLMLRYDEAKRKIQRLLDNLGDLERLRALGGVRVLGTRVDLELHLNDHYPCERKRAV